MYAIVYNISLSQPGNHTSGHKHKWQFRLKKNNGPKYRGKIPQCRKSEKKLEKTPKTGSRYLQ